MKTIALCIPAFNSHKYILPCIESIRNAKVPDGYELDIRIAVDGQQDLSDLLTANNIPHYFSLFNEGVGKIRNSLLYLRPADIYVSFDSDDLMAENFFAYNIPAMTDTNYHFLRPKKKNFRTEPYDKTPTPYPYGGVFIMTAWGLAEIGGYHPVRLHEDTELFERLTYHPREIFMPPEVTWYRRRNEDSVTRNPSILTDNSLRKHPFGIHIRDNLNQWLEREEGLSFYCFPYTTYLEPRAGAI